MRDRRAGPPEVARCGILRSVGALSSRGHGARCLTNSSTWFRPPWREHSARSGRQETSGNPMFAR